MSNASQLLRELDWGALAPLRLRVSEVAAGLYTGNHKSIRRGSGIEFDSHRDYVRGDDLRRLDTRALARHGKLLIRQFETETERCLCLLLDATASMAYRSPKAPGAKLAYAAVLAAALAKVTLATGDAVSLDWIAGDHCVGLKQAAGPAVMERLFNVLEHARTGGEEPRSADAFSGQLVNVARRAKRGSLVVLFSDLVDLPEQAESAFAALAHERRVVIAVQVLDQYEAEFPFDGPIRLRASVDDLVVETDAGQARAGYLAALSRCQDRWRDALQKHGGSLVTCTSRQAPIDVVRQILRTAGRVHA